MDSSKKKSGVENPYANYTAVKGHPNYYQNAASKKIIFKKTINGVVQKIATGATRINEAKKVAEAELAKRFSINLGAEKRKKQGVTNPSLQDVWNDLIEDKRAGAQPHTLENYTTSAKYGFGPFWFKLTVADVTQANQTAFENWYLKNRGDKDYYNTRKHLRMLFNHLHRHDMIRKVPVFKDLQPIIAKKTKKRKPGRVFTAAEFKGMMNAVAQVEKEPAEILRLEIFILMGRKQGRRDREGLEAKWSDNDFENKTSEVWSLKNGKWRTVPMTDDLAEKLSDLRELCPKDTYIFPMVSDPKRPVASQVYNRKWTEVKRIAGITNWNVRNAARYHDLRHTFATQTAVDRWPIIIACQMLDMTVKEYQRTYTHITGGDINLLMRESFGGGK